MSSRAPPVRYPCSPRSLCSLANRIPARRRSPHGAVQLAVCPPLRRNSRPAHRRHRPRALHARKWSKAFSKACAGSASIGTKAHTTRPSAWNCIAETAAKLVASGHAYYCFCTKEELEQRRGPSRRRGASAALRRTCRRISPEEAAERRAARRSPPRCDLPCPNPAAPRFDDAVFGHVEFANSELEDFVLLRSDGGPTYHLSVVTDDLDMRITHVIRGADHISNTPKQVLLYQALGAPLPVFAHVPLILGPDKTRLSKRHGATSVMAYREEGIVPEAFRNFLALLGWTPPAGNPRDSGRSGIDPALSRSTPSRIRMPSSIAPSWTGSTPSTFAPIPRRNSCR